jgi:protease PrsW
MRKHHGALVIRLRYSPGMVIVSWVLSALSTVCAVFPMVAFLTAVWWMDRYDREPVWLVGLTFLWGGIGSILLALAGSTVMQILFAFAFGAATSLTGYNTHWLLAAAGPTVIAPLVEEPSKALFLLFVIWNRHFDNMTDGFVYGAAAGLGFGMTENFMYFVNTSGNMGTWGTTVIIRTFYSAVMHATCTAIVGAGLGWARFRGPFVLLAAGIVGLGSAMGVHALWNGLLTIEEYRFVQDLGVSMLAVNLVIFPMQAGFVFIIFQLCLLEESLNIRRELEEEASNGVIPYEHPAILASWLRRLGQSWLPVGVDQERYVVTATSLAMRKKQVRLMRHRAPDFYKDDVKRLRSQLKKLLA